MTHHALFTSLPSEDAQPQARVTIDFDGRPLSLPAGVTLAAGLLEAGVRHFRSSPVDGSPRAPYCMMGVCFDCLLDVDGIANQQACQLLVREGMQVRTPDAISPQTPWEGDQRDERGAQHD